MFAAVFEGDPAVGGLFGIAEVDHASIVEHESDTVLFFKFTMTADTHVGTAVARDRDDVKQ